DGSQKLSATVPVQLGVDHHFLLAWSSGAQVLYLNGQPFATAAIPQATYAYSGLQVGGNAGAVYNSSPAAAASVDHTLADVAMGNGYTPTASESLALANGTKSPLQMGTAATAWWPLGGGTVSTNPVGNDLTDAWGWLADYTGNGNTLSIASTTPAGSLSNAT